MAIDVADSQYLLILAPSLVITLMFLFFWLFMRETSYDEVLARQKRDLKLPPVKTDTRKKSEKKKNKKKETAGGGAGGGGKGDELDEDLLDFVASEDDNPTLNNEEPEVVPVPQAVAITDHSEPPVVVRERKKKEKKPKAAAAAPPAVATVAAPVIAEEPKANDSKPVVRKDHSPPLEKQQSPPQPQTTPSAPAETSNKKRAKKQKTEAEEPLPELKPDQSPVVMKKVETVLEAVKLQDSSATPAVSPPASTTSTGSGKKRNKKQKTEALIAVNETHVQSSPPVSPTASESPANHKTSKNPEAQSSATPPVSISTKQSKKQKNETDKENSRVKLKELLANLGGLVLSDADVISVVSLLKDKSPSALDSWCKTAAKSEPSAQQLAEKESLLTSLQELASVTNEKVKQLSQDLQMEKQKRNHAETLLRDQRAAVEKDRSVMQAKAQTSYQEMQMKFQKIREQLEGQISRLQSENSIFREAVSTASNQLETKQTSELKQLHSERSSLVKDLSEAKNKLQQEEVQRKNLEVNYKQNVSQLEVQLQDAKRRWEELQNYLHSVNSEREKLQSAKQELQNQLIAAETEMSNKNKEIQTLHSNLTDTIVSKEQVEQKVLQLVSKHNLQPDTTSLQAQVQDLINENNGLKVQIESLQHQVASQANAVSHFDELQKLLSDKELQRKSLEDSLNAERSSGASRETNMQAIHNENMALKSELQNLQAQISEQASSHLAVDQLKQSLQEKEEKVKTVERLLETALIQVANKEEELKTVKVEHEHLMQQVGALQLQTVEQKQSNSAQLEELQKQSREKDEKIKSVEESLQSALNKESSRVQVIEELQQQLENRSAELTQLRSRETQESSDSKAQLVSLQTQLSTQQQEIQRLHKQVEEKSKEAEEKMAASAQLLDLQALLTSKDQELQMLRKEMEEKSREIKAMTEQQQTAVPSQEFLIEVTRKDQQLSDVQAELQVLREDLQLQRKKNNELREKNWCALEALSATETMLQGKLNKIVKESQTSLECAEAECRAVLHRLLPHVPLPSDQNHMVWLQNFESSMRKASAGGSAVAIEANCTPVTDDEAKVLAERLRETEEAQKVLQKDCETYKKVLAETEGILQQLQSSVEHEEHRWKEKLEVAQIELKEMTSKVTLLEQEVDRLSTDGEMESLRKAKEQLQSDLERAEQESATYVSEVRELKDLLTELQSKLDGSYTEAVRQNEELNLLKTQLTETLEKLQTEESERLKVAGDLYKAQQSLELIQEEILKEASQADLIQNSSLTAQVETDHKVAAGLNQTVRELQELLQAVNRQLTKGQERSNGDGN